MAKRISKEERRKALQDRTNKNVENSGKGDFGARYISTTGYTDVKWYKPEAKVKNYIDILPYVISTKMHPQGMKPGYEDYLLDLYVHRNVGPKDDAFICLSKNYGKACPVCEEKARLEKAGKDDEAKLLKPKRRAIYNVIDLNNPDDGIQIFDVTHYFFEKELTEELKGSYTDGEIPIFSDIEEGMSIKFRGSEESFNGAKFLKYKSFSFVDRDEQYKDSILDEVFPLDAMIVVPSYDEVYASFYGESFEEDDDDDEVEKEEVVEEKDEEVTDEPPKTAPRKRRERKTAKEEPVNPCPFGHKFGADNLADHCADDCDKCEIDNPDVFDKCDEAYEELNS